MNEIMIGVYDGRPGRDFRPFITLRDQETVAGWAEEYPDIIVFLVRVSTDVELDDAV